MLHRYVWNNGERDGLFEGTLEGLQKLTALFLGSYSHHDRESGFKTSGRPLANNFGLVSPVVKKSIQNMRGDEATSTWVMSVNESIRL